MDGEGEEGGVIIKGWYKEDLWDDETVLYPDCDVITQISTCDKMTVL